MVLQRRQSHGSQWAVIRSMAGKIGCMAQTLCKWVRQVERSQGLRPDPSNEEQLRVMRLGRENRELRQSSEILRKASAYFVQAALERRFKP